MSKDNAKSAANKLEAFINELMAQSGVHITPEAAEKLAMDAEWFLANTDLAVAARVAYWAEIVAPIVNQPVGYTNLSLTRDYNDESLIGDIVTDSMLWSSDLYDDGEMKRLGRYCLHQPGRLTGGYPHPGWRFTAIHGHLGRHL